MKSIKKWFACLLAASVVLTTVSVNAIEPNMDNPSSVIIPNSSTELESEEDFSEAGQEADTSVTENNEISDTTDNSEISINTESNDASTEENSAENAEENQNHDNEVYSQINTLAEPEGENTEEVDSWSINTVFYDSTVDNGHTPLTEVNWNAVSKDEERVITVQINYRNTNAVTSYQRGELSFKVPLLTETIQGIRDCMPYDIAFDDPSISAGTIEQGYDWNYKIKDGNIIFTNNNIIEASSNFEGSIQIGYVLLSGKIANNTNKSMNVVLSNNSEEILTSNDIVFNFTSNKASYNLIKTPNVVKGLDRLPSNASNYIWVKWDIENTPIWNEVRIATLRSVVFEEIVPEGALVYDNNMNLVEAVDGKIRFNATTFRNRDGGVETTVYIAYPKDRYEGQKITNTINSYGIYWDETEESFLASYSKEIDLKKYVFTYTGNLYGIKKDEMDRKLPSYWCRNGGAQASFNIVPCAIYNGKPMDVIIGDDIMFAPNKNGDYERLTDDEYYFYELSYNGRFMENMNGILIKDYDMELQVRYKNTSEYVKFGETLKANEDYSSISFTEGVVGWRIIIHNMEESLKPPYVSSLIQPDAKIIKNDIADTGYLYNFAYIQVYQDGILQNEPDLSSYDSNATKLDIATFDKDTYRTYMQRACAASEIISNALEFEIRKSETKFVDYPSEEKFKNSYSLSTSLDIVYGSTDNLKKFSCYDLLPKGMELESTEEEIISNLLLKTKSDFNKISISDIERKSGIKFENETEILNYFKNNCSVTIIENWRNTGRTWLKVEFDFSDDPLSIIRKFSRDTIIPLISININTSVSYDAYLEYGNTYKNIFHLYVNEAEGWSLHDYYNLLKDTGSYDADTVDINDNGTTEDKIYSVAKTSSINAVIATHQDVQKQVKTDKNDFTIGQAVGSYNSEYTYKLRVKTGENNITNLVIYDSIEKYIKDKDGNITEAYGAKDHWNGEFLEVDTSYAEEKGYTVKTYYSEQENAGNLYNEDGSLNTNYKEYTTGIKPDYSKSVTITSPNWPNNYPSQMNESSNFWEESFSGADKLQVVFDNTSKTEKSFDYIFIYDKNGQNISGDLSGTDFAGKTYIVEGDYVKIAMKSDGGIQYKGFSATITPLYKEAATDKTKVKSLAFEYLDKDGNKAILPANSLTYVLVKMKSPADETITSFAYNGCYTEWNAIDKYGNVVDFITGINSNVVKVGLLNSVDDEALPVINVNFKKDIVGEEKAFNYLRLDKNDLYSFAITMKEKETGYVYNGVVNNQRILTFTKIPYGTYEIEESNNHYFDFVDMIEDNGDSVLSEGITLSKDNGKYVLTISDTVKEDLSYNIKVTNEIKKERLYEEKNEIFNIFSAVK